MRYSDGNQSRCGDVVLINGRDRGLVLADIEAGQYSDGLKAEDWSYLGRGVLVKTDFAGLVHYENASSELITLQERRGEA
jgi:hypothetical protein